MISRHFWPIWVSVRLVIRLIGSIITGIMSPGTVAGLPESSRLTTGVDADTGGNPHSDGQSMGSRSKKSNGKVVTKMEAQKQAVSPDKPAGLNFNKTVSEKKKEAIDCLTDMLSIFIEVSKGCDRKKVQKFYDHRRKAHRLILEI